MAIVPTGYPLGLQDAGSNPVVTTAPVLTEITLTPGTTSFNTLQSWTDIQYSPFGGPGSTMYTRYIKNLTGGWLHGYSESMQYSGMSGSSNGAGGTLGPTASAALLDSGSPGSASGTESGPNNSYQGSPYSSNRSKIMSSSISTYGLIPPNAVGFDGQFAEGLFNTSSYQNRSKHGQDFTCNASGSIGSVSNSANLEFESENGTEWKIIQIIAGQNVYNSGNFPNAQGPYSGSNQVHDNLGNFIYIALFRKSGHLTNTQSQNMHANDIFSHIQLNNSTIVLTSGLPGVSVPSGLTALAATSANTVWGAYTTNVNQCVGFLWPNIGDTQVRNFIDYAGSGTMPIKVYSPVTSVTFNNGIAEEHGGNDSNNVKTSDYIKGAEYVATGNGSSTIPSSQLDVSFSKYQGSVDDGVPAGSSGVFVDSGSNSNYYPYRGAGVYGASIDFVYGQGLVAQPAFGLFVPSTTTARTFAIDGDNQVLTEASIAYATPNGTNLIVRLTPASGSLNDIVGPNTWTITLTKTNNTSHGNTLTLTSGSSGHAYSVQTSSQASGQIIPSATLSFMTSSPSTTNNYIYNWITDNGTKLSIQDFTIAIS